MQPERLCRENCIRPVWCHCLWWVIRPVQCLLLISRVCRRKLVTSFVWHRAGVNSRWLCKYDAVLYLAFLLTGLSSRSNSTSHAWITEDSKQSLDQLCQQCDSHDNEDLVGVGAGAGSRVRLYPIQPIDLDGIVCNTEGDVVFWLLERASHVLGRPTPVSQMNTYIRCFQVAVVLRCTLTFCVCVRRSAECGGACVLEEAQVKRTGPVQYLLETWDKSAQAEAYIMKNRESKDSRE